MHPGRLLPHHIQHLHRLLLRPAPDIYSSKLTVEDASQGDSDLPTWVRNSVSNPSSFGRNNGCRLIYLAIL